MNKYDELAETAGSKTWNAFKEAHRAANPELYKARDEASAAHDRADKAIYESMLAAGADDVWSRAIHETCEEGNEN